MPLSKKEDFQKDKNLTHYFTSKCFIEGAQWGALAYIASLHKNSFNNIGIKSLSLNICKLAIFSNLFGAVSAIICDNTKKLHKYFNNKNNITKEHDEISRK